MALINGTEIGDTLTGTLASDVIKGFAGDDVIRGLAGNDVLIGGFGNNILDGGSEIDTASYAGSLNNVIASLETGKAKFFGGEDTFISIENLIGSDNDDVLTGNNLSNTLEGGAGGDRIFGGFGLDNLRGGDGIDVLDGGDSRDVIQGDKGNDTMIGGNGDDSFFWIDGDGSDVIRGDAGDDDLNFIGSKSTSQGDRITLNPVDSEVVLQRTSPGPITIKTQGIETFQISGVEGDDVFIVKDLGLASGVKTVGFNGGDGNDRMEVTFTSVAFNVNGGNGNDSLVGANFNDSLDGGQGNDILLGGAGNDTLTGATSLNQGRGEIDVLVGGAGRDTFVLGKNGQTFYDDGNGITDGDTINFFQNVDGTGDFARILDFRVGEDVIELAGPRSSYELRTITNSLAGGSATPDMGIFKNGLPDELIGIVQDAPTTLNLANTSQFRFV